MISLRQSYILEPAGLLNRDCLVGAILLSTCSFDDQRKCTVINACLDCAAFILNLYTGYLSALILT